MKIKTISRSFETASRGASSEVRKVHHNPSPALHPFEAGREYTRALTAAKMDRMFARPFIAAMSEHSDGVYCSATSPASLVAFVSGSADGEVIVWDLASHEKLWSVYAHTGFVRGVCVSTDGDHFFSCGDDRTIKQYRMVVDDALAMEDAPASGAGAGAGAKRARPKRAPAPKGGDRRRRRRDEEDADYEGADSEAEESEDEDDAVYRSASGKPARDVTPVHTWTGKHAFLNIDHHWKSPMFATASIGIDVWDTSRSEPVHSYAWGADSVTTVRWNPAEPSLLASTGNDRSVCLYDIRTDSALRKVVMSMNSNAMAWNPREPFNFTIANEDSNCYTFDMRKLDAALMVHKDHVSAVMDISYSPTGREFVTGSYDRTVRIWKAGAGKSREIYHTKRMQRVFSVKFTGDAKYVISGSDDTNVRIWKAEASAILGRTLPRERAKMDYNKALAKRYGHMPEIKKIATSRHVPKLITKQKAARFAEEQKVRRKLANVRANTRPGSGEGMPEAERTKRWIKEEK